MAHPAQPLPVAAGTLPVLDVDAMLARLPAQARASVAWAKKPIAEGLARLRTETLTDELVSAVADQILAPVQAIGVAAWRALAANLDSYRAAMMSDFAHEEDRLAAFVDDDDACDTVAWITGFLRSFYGTALATGADVAIDEGAWKQIASEPELIPFVRGLAALMAAAEEARVGTDTKRARELVDLAFLQLTQFRDVLRRYGLQLSAFPYETTEQRRENLSEAARRVRANLTEDDWRTIHGARVGDLR
jgi:hypothetical protein